MFADPIIGSELEEERAIKAARCTVIDVLDARLIAHACGFYTGLETPLRIDDTIDGGSPTHMAWVPARLGVGLVWRVAQSKTISSA